MEENSDAHMETDVSSTTDDVPETQEVTGSCGDVEMVVVVEEVKEEEDSSIDLNDEKSHGSKISSASTSCEVSPLKEGLSQKNALRPLVNENIVAKKMLSSINSCESQKILNKTSQISNKTSPVKQQEESLESSTTIETNIFPGQSIEKAAERNPIKISQFQKIIHKSPFPDTKVMSKPPIKLNRGHTQLRKEFVVQDKTPIKFILEKPEQASNTKLQESPSKIMQENLNKQGILQEHSTNKCTSPPENTSIEIKSLSSNEKTNDITSMKNLIDSTITKRITEPSSNNRFEPTLNKKAVESTSSITVIEQTSKNMAVQAYSFKKLADHTSNKNGVEAISTKKVVETTPNKKVVEQTSKSAGETSTKKLVEHTRSKNAIESPAKMVVESTSNKIVEPTSSTKVVEATSDKKAVETTSNKKAVEPTSSTKVVKAASNKDPVNSITLNNIVEPTQQPNYSNNKQKSISADDKFQDSTSANKGGSTTDSSKVNNKASKNDLMETDETIETQNAKDNPVSTIHPADDDVDDLFNNSQNGTDTSEKEHNKSISRELKSLIKSAKESKIISECTQLTSKTRKSRSQLDASNTSLNISLESERIGYRRGSTNSQISNCSEKSDKALKRSMRSQNPEFVSKCKQFLNSVTSKVMKDTDEPMSEDEPNINSKEKTDTGPEHTDSSPTSPKKKRVLDQSIIDDKEKSNKIRSDAYCWRCHWTVEQEENDKAHPPMYCTVCPRAYHYKCASSSERKIPQEKNWVCPECLQILHAESSDTRSPAMKKTSLGMLCDLLKYALERMMDLNGVEPFMHPVDRTAFPDYDKYVIHPMDLTQMKQNIADGLYGSTEAFVADAQWILHNSIIFNTLQSKLTGGARALVRSCRAEMGEIEACPECYAAAHARKPTWFTDVCTTPHILLWAKLKGFPYWPAKGMTINSSGLVDVRFFGAHDRAWVPAKDCFLFSEKDPNNFRNKRQDILVAMQEAEQHIRNISRKYGKFVYPPFKTQFDPSKLTEQLKMMIPSFEGEIKTPMKEKHRNSSPSTAKVKRRSTSKGSKSSANDGDGSESEDMPTTARSETIRVEKDSSSEKVGKEDSPSITRKLTLQIEDIPTSRKRRRSQLEEACVMTLIESSVREKKRKISVEQEKPDHQEPSTSKEVKAQLITKEAKVAETTAKKTDTPKVQSKDEEQSSSAKQEKESLRVTPIKLVALPRQNKQTPKLFTATKIPSKPSSPREEDKTPQRAKSSRSDKSSSSEKADKEKAQKRRNSKTHRSSSTSNTPKSAKTIEKKTDNNNSTSGKELKAKENKKKDTKETDGKSLLKPIDTPKSGKDRLRFDDDTTLAAIARDRRRSASGLPTISSVCSLSTTAQASATTLTPTTSTAPIEITVEASMSSNIFTPTSTDSVLNTKDAASKLQKIRDNTEPVVGRVGVRAFARMTSPGRSDNVEVEIKAEPVDLEEADESRQTEKMDLMNACKLQPVSQAQTLRDVRINRAVVAPVVNRGKVEARARARKTFPQPRRDEGRSELNGKNSMVYIPIQPPATQPPVRPARPVVPVHRPVAPLVGGNNAVNTLITPLKPSTASISNPAGPSIVTSAVAQVTVPTVGQVPTTVHTVPLMTSVNGQWMFSLQPVMSVGGVDNSPPTPLVNGLPDRSAAPPAVLPIPPNAVATVSASTTPAQNRTRNDSTTPTELPRLQQRPHPFDASAPSVYAPSNAGPAIAKLNQNAVKLADFFRSLLEESLEKMDEPGSAAATLRVQLETSRWRHAQEMNELKHNHELTLAEMRLTFEKDKLRVINEVKRAAQAELDVAVKAAKSKQWCANCNQEAQFYCCWNTAYCDYPCQRVHWQHHYINCAQKPQDENEDDSGPSESRLQAQPDILPRSAPPAAPALTVGGKITSRAQPTPQENAPQKTQIIVSMVEDNSGTPTLKCVGTYKQSQPQGQAQPLILNKQVINEDPSKKVVTSGGYLIVGAAGNTASVITPAPTRRSHAIQYFT